MFSIAFLHAEIQSLPPVKLNECVNLSQTHPNATSINITNIRYPSSSEISTIIPMSTSNNIDYFYSFCNTTEYGTYLVTTCGNGDGVFDCVKYDFKVNGSGQDVNSSQISLIIIGVFVLLIMVIFFFILALLFKHPGTKIFLMSLSALTLILIIGLISSNTSIYLAEFPGLVSIIEKYYIFLTILAGVCMFGIIVWLIYYAFTLFNKTRGRYIDDD